jgi:hypothetical protein
MKYTNGNVELLDLGDCLELTLPGEGHSWTSKYPYTLAGLRDAASSMHESLDGELALELLIDAAYRLGQKQPLDEPAQSD